LTDSTNYLAALDRLDEYFEAAYFSPLSVNDALAVQFLNPALKGLPIQTIRDVFNLVDRLKDGLTADRETDQSETEAAALFYKHLQQEHPELFEIWIQGDPSVHLDPGGAILNAETMGRDTIVDFLRHNHFDLDPELLAKTVESAVLEIIRGLKIKEDLDDREIRQSLRTGILKNYPPWARPSIYLEIWSRFVRTITDLDSDPDLRAIWPY
jgi:hypothetical protein